MKLFLMLVSGLCFLLGYISQRKLNISLRDRLITVENFNKRIIILMIYPVLGMLLGFVAVIFLN